MNDANGYRNFHYSAQDGLRLHARIYGDRNTGNLPVVCLAGLTRNARDFHHLALTLAHDPKNPRMVIAFDYRGRGLSAWDKDWSNYDFAVEAGDILHGLAALDIAHAAFIGTSRGGLIMHVLAAARPGVMKAGVLNDVGPVVDGAGLAMIRSYLDRAPKPKTWDEAVAIQTASIKETFPALKETDYRRMVEAFFDEKDGSLVAAYDPALLKTVRAIDLSKPLPEFWPQFKGLTAMPLMAIRGEHSRLLSAETFEKMKRFHPPLEAITVEGQGHAPLLETAGLPARIAAFLSRADSLG